MGAAVTTRRVAKKPHQCGCGDTIRPGDVYLRHVAFPGHEANERGSWVGPDGLPVADRPWALPECAPCATRYGRATDLDPVPYEQCARQGLL